ncbi:MAG: hypothetical protein UE068_14855, partial [Paludibacteraceae bacterium]|nr:hypothetical protein [Paludibacteraceae bacterium]
TNNGGKFTEPQDNGSTDLTSVIYNFVAVNTSTQCMADPVSISVRNGVTPKITMEAEPLASCEVDGSNTVPANLHVGLVSSNNDLTSFTSTIETEVLVVNGVSFANPTFDSQTHDFSHSVDLYTAENTYSASYTDALGCKAEPVTAKALKVGAPRISATVNATVCPGESNTITINDMKDGESDYEIRAYEIVDAASASASAVDTLGDKTGAPTGKKFDPKGGVAYKNGTKFEIVIPAPNATASGVTREFRVVSSNVVNGTTCYYSTPVSFKINKTPVINITATADGVTLTDGGKVCPNAELQFNLSNSAYNSSVTTWGVTSDKRDNFITGNVSSTDGGNAIIEKNALSTVATETLTFTATNGGCSNSETFQFTVVNASPLSIKSSETRAAEDGVTLFCENDKNSKTLSAKQTTFSEYKWYIDDVVVNGETTSSITVHGPADGNNSWSSAKTYLLKAKDENGCWSTATEIVKVAPLPEITLNASPKTVCEGETIELTAQKSASSYSKYGDDMPFTVKYTDKNNTVNFTGTIASNTETTTANVLVANMIEDGTQRKVSAFAEVTIDNKDVCVGEPVSQSVTVISTPTIISVVKNANGVALTPVDGKYMLCPSSKYTIDVKVDPALFTNSSYSSNAKFAVVVDGDKKTLNGTNTISFEKTDGITSAVSHNISIVPLDANGDEKSVCSAVATVKVDVYKNPVVKLYASATQSSAEPSGNNVGLNGAYICSGNSLFANSYVELDPSLANNNSVAIEWSADDYAVPSSSGLSIGVNQKVTNLKARVTDVHGCVSDWSAPLDFVICQPATPALTVPNVCDGSDLKVSLTEADINLRSELLNSAFTHYKLSYYNGEYNENVQSSEIVEYSDNYDPALLVNNEYVSTFNNISSTVSFLATAYNACGNRNGFLKAECSSSNKPVVKMTTVNKKPVLDVVFQIKKGDNDWEDIAGNALSDNTSEIPAICPNTSFRIKVRDNNHVNGVYTENVDFSIDGEISSRSADATIPAESWVERVYYDGLEYNATNQIVTFNISAENNSGCTNSVIAKIKVNERPKVTLTANTTTTQEFDYNNFIVYVCEGQNATVKANVMGKNTDAQTTAFSYYEYATDTKTKDAAPNKVELEKNYGGYYAEYVDPATGCKSMPSNLIYVDYFTKPEFHAYTDPSMICGSQSTTAIIKTVTVGDETYDANKYNFTLLTKCEFDSESNTISSATEGVRFFGQSDGSTVASITNYSDNSPFGAQITYGKGCVARDIVTVAYTNAPEIQFGLFANKTVNGTNPCLDRNVTSTNDDSGLEEQNGDRSKHWGAKYENDITDIRWRDENFIKYTGVNLCGTERAWFYIRNGHVYNAANGETAPVKDSIVVKAQDVVISKVIDRQPGRIPSFTQFWYRRDLQYNSDGSPILDANGNQTYKDTYLPYASNGVIDYTIEIHPIMADGSISCPAIKRVTAKAYNAPTGKFLVPTYVCENTEFDIKFQGVKSNPGDTLLFDYNGNSQYKLPYQAITNPVYTAGTKYLYYEREGGIARYNGFVEPRSAAELAATENSKDVATGTVYNAYDNDLIKIYPKRFNTSENKIEIDNVIAANSEGNKFKLNKASGVLTMAADGTYGTWAVWVRVENQYRCASTVSKTIYCYTMDGINVKSDIACEGDAVEIYANDGTSNLGRGYSFSFYEMDKSDCGD